MTTKQPKRVKSFRITETAAFHLGNISREYGCTEADVINVALDCLRIILDNDQVTYRGRIDNVRNACMMALRSK